MTTDTKDPNPTLDETTAQALRDFEEKLKSGKPIMSFFIDPPFQCNIENNVLHVDAPCMAAGGSHHAAVLRITYSAAAAKALRDVLNKLQFDEVDGPASPAHRTH